MNYKTLSISKKRFLTVILVNITFLMLFILLSGIYHVKLSPAIFFTIFLGFIFLGGSLALKFSKRTIFVSLTDRNLKFDNTNILLSDLYGYYINNEGGLVSEIELKDINNNIYTLSSVNYGKNGKEFETFLSDFLKQTSNSNIKELSYYDFHNKQYILIKNIIYFAFTIVIILNIIYLYLVFIKGIPFNWKILFVNFMLFWLYNFHRKNEKKYKRQ